MDKVSVQNDLNNLVKNIDFIDRRAAQHLEDLSNALDNATQAKTWAGVDLDRLINPDSISERYEQYYQPDQGGSGRLVEALELIRNIFIFLPIVVTWFSISQATSAYQAFVIECSKTCKDQLQFSFLYLWEQGFNGHLAGILRLSTIGLIDASILALIFLATLYVSVASVSSNRRNELTEQRIHGQAQALRSDLINALADTTILLHSQSSLIVSPIDKLDDVARAIVQMSNTILRQFDSLKNSLESVADEMKSQFKTTQEASQQLLHQVGDISSMIQAFQVAINQFQRASEMANIQLGKLIQPIEELTHEQQNLFNRVNESADHLKTSADYLGTIQRDQQEWGEKITNTLEQQNDVVGKLDVITNALNVLERQLDGFLTRLGEEREAQEQQAIQMANASRSFSDALDYTRDEAVQLRSISIDLHDITDTMARLSNTSGMDVSGIVSSYQQAAETIDEGATALKETAMVIFDAAQELKTAAEAFKTTIPSS